MQLADGKLTKQTAAAIYKTFYSKRNSEKIARSKFCTESAALLANVLYNPEYARKLITVRTDLVPSEVTQKIAKAVYQEDIL